MVEWPEKKEYHDGAFENTDYACNCRNCISVSSFNACHDAFMKVIESRSNHSHCQDCCCARAWEALGVKEYTGKSIYEHILELKKAIESQPKGLLELLDRERVSALLWQVERGDSCPNNEKLMLMEECYRRADAICCQFGTLPQRNLPSVKEQEKFINDLAENFKKIAEENMLPMSNRACRMFAMIANTKTQNILAMLTEG